MAIEIPDLDKWNAWLSGGAVCGCCGMPECDEPDHEDRVRTIEGGALWWELLLAADETEPTGVDGTFGIRRWWTLTRVGTFSWADTKPTSPVGLAGAFTFEGTGVATLVLTWTRESDAGGATYTAAASGIVVIEQSEWEDDYTDPSAASLYRKKIVTYTPATQAYAEYLIYERAWGFEHETWEADVATWESEMADWGAEPENAAAYATWATDFATWETDYATWQSGGATGMPPLPPDAPDGAPEAPELGDRPEDPGNADPTGWSADSVVETYENHTGTLLDTTDPYYHGWHQFPATESTFVNPPSFTIELWPFHAPFAPAFGAVSATDDEGFTAARTYTAWDSTTSTADSSVVTGSNLFGTLAFEDEVDPLFDGMTDEEIEDATDADPIAVRVHDIASETPWVVVDPDTEETRAWVRWKIPYPWERSTGQVRGSYYEVSWDMKFTPQAYIDWQTALGAWEGRRDAWVAEDPGNNDPADYETENPGDPEPEQPVDSDPTLLTHPDSPWEWSYPTGDWATWADDYLDYVDDLEAWEARRDAWIDADPDERDEAAYIAAHPADPKPTAPEQPAGDNPWFSDWFQIAVPATTTEDEPKIGTVEVVNFKYLCYHGAVYGAKPQIGLDFEEFNPSP